MKTLALVSVLLLSLAMLGAMKQVTPAVIASDGGRSINVGVKAATTDERSTVALRCDDVADVQTGVRYSDAGGVTANDNDPLVYPGQERTIQLAPGENAVAVKANDAGVIPASHYPDGGNYIDGGSFDSPYGSQSVHCNIYQVTSY